MMTNLTSPTPAPAFPRRAAAKARTRARIEAAASRIFAELGYQDATLAAIADAADVHVTTLFTHFASKRDLLAAVASAAGDWLDAAAASQQAERVRALDFWADLVGRAAEAYERDAPAHLLLGRAMAGEPELLPAWIAHQRRQVMVMTRYLAADLGVDPAIDKRPQMAAAMLVAGGLLAFDAWLASGRQGDLVAENRALLQAATAILAGDLARVVTHKPDQSIAID